MKKFTLVFLLLPFAGMAQFNRGQVFFGGSMNAQYSNSQSGYISNSFSVTPKAGYFLNERWALGVMPGVNFSNQTSSNNYASGSTVSKNNSTGISAAIFGRRYVAISERFLFMIEGNVNIGQYKTTTTYTQTDANGVLISTSNSKTSSNSFGVYLQPLFIFFPSPQWGFEAGLGYLGVSRQRNPGFTSVNLSFGGLSLGVTYYFKRS